MTHLRGVGAWQTTNGETFANVERLVRRRTQSEGVKLFWQPPMKNGKVTRPSVLRSHLQRGIEGALFTHEDED